MIWSNEFIELNKSIHDRESFDCGEAELNIFLKTKAAKHMDIGISKTLVLPSAKPSTDNKYQICSFYSIAPSSISRENLPQNLAKKLPTYPVPVFLIGQLSVNSQYHGKGLGKITLVKALEYLWKVNLQMKAYAVIVDCLNDNAKQFYLKYDFQILTEINGKVRMFLPMKTIELLFKEY